MDCSRFLAGYSDYDDSLLPPAAEAEFRAHLAACDACRRYDRVLRKGRMLARQVSTVPSPEFMPRLQHRLLDARPVPLPVSPAVAGGFLTLMMAAVTGLWVFDADPDAAGPRLAAGVIPAHGGAGMVASRPLTLPVLSGVAPADWTTGRVDRTSASSYSPLVIGPPAYGADRSPKAALTSTTRRTLD